MNTVFSPLDAILGGTQNITLSSSNVTLTQTQFNNKAFKLSGTLLANVSLLLPLSVNAVGGTPGVGGEFVVWNTCTGNFSVTVATAVAGSTGVVVPQGARTTLYSDTVNVWYADDSFGHLIGSNTAVGASFDGGGSVIVNGKFEDIYMPFSATINDWRVIADQAGSITFDVLRANFAVPTASIVGSGNAPLLSSQQINSAVPSGWTSTTLNRGDFVQIKVNGVPASVQHVDVFLEMSRTSA